MTTIYTGENVVIKGQITFGNDCSIWHNSVIRTENDPITIGDQTNIQDLVIFLMQNRLDSFSKHQST